MLNLSDCIAANRPCIFITCESDIEVLRYLDEKFNKGNFFVYSTTMARCIKLKDILKEKFAPERGKSESTLDALDSILHRKFHETNNFFETYVFLDCDGFIQDRQIIRKIKDILSRYQLDTDFTVNLIFISQVVCVPPLLERLSEVVFFDLPDETALKNLSDNLTNYLELKGDAKPTDEVVNNLKGLTLFETEQAYIQSWQMFQGINLNFIRDFKKSSISKTDLLALMETGITFNDIGGASVLKDWVKKSFGGWTVEGKKFGLPLLKGLLMIGLPGCGKSLLCKAIGNEWGLPVISFDPSRVFSSRVGESEHNIRRILQIVENIAPCLSGNTRITLANGQVTSIKKLYDNKYRGNVISLGDDYKQDISKVSLITKKQSSDLYNVKTIIGNIKATGNHKFPILKNNEELYWMSVDNIKKGDFIVCPRKVGVDKIPRVMDKYDQWFSSGDFFFSKVKEISKIKGLHDVYDLCLDKNHNFIANGMFTHNCVLFIDEIEKGFAGSQSSTFSDSGVTARVIGTFLTWMQDCSKPVFTVATSNNIQYLPPELIQRFDEKFFVNLPQMDERKEIYRIHIKKLNRDPVKFDLEALAQASQDLSGREIEQALREAMYNAFHQKEDINTQVILRVLSKKTSLLSTMSEQLSYTLDWVGWDPDKNDGKRARFAHPTETENVTRVRDLVDKLIDDIEKGKKDS